jgi:hypothetical protein
VGLVFKTQPNGSLWEKSTKSDAPPSSLCDPKRVQKVGFAKLVRNLVLLLASNTRKGKGVVLEAPRLD